MAQNESTAISDRTRAALQAAKARGQVLCNPNGADALRRAGKGNGASCADQKADAFHRALDLSDTLADVQASGITTLAAIAGELNRRGMKTARGGAWHASSVANLRARVAS